MARSRRGIALFPQSCSGWPASGVHINGARGHGRNSESGDCYEVADIRAGLRTTRSICPAARPSTAFCCRGQGPLGEAVAASVLNSAHTPSKIVSIACANSSGNEFREAAMVPFLQRQSLQPQPLAALSYVLASDRSSGAPRLGAAFVCALRSYEPQGLGNGTDIFPRSTAGNRSLPDALPFIDTSKADHPEEGRIRCFSIWSMLASRSEVKKRSPCRK